MWIITKTGFVSVVQHEDDDLLMRARSRRREHLLDTFSLTDEDIHDLGDDAPDYRWHANVSRRDVAEALIRTVYDVDYTSHVKESVAREDEEFYRAMLACWAALNKLQPRRPGRTLRDLAGSNYPATALFDDYYDEDEDEDDEDIDRWADRAYEDDPFDLIPGN